jgi:hypothetical protein
MRYQVQATSIFGGREEWEYQTKADALSKVRELKDIGTYLVYLVELNKETV